METNNKQMTVLDLIKIVEKIAQEYRPEAIKSIKRNTHLHDCDLKDIGCQDFIDAILSDFINFLAGKYGCDYGTHAYDIYWPEALSEYKKVEELKYINLAEYEKELEKWQKIKEKKHENS